MPIFNNSSSAIRSAPHVGLFSAISPIRFRTSTGTRGRPAGLDFHFQNSRIPFRSFLRTTGVRASLHETFGRSEAKGIVKTIRLPYPKEAFSIPLTGIVVEQM